MAQGISITEGTPRTLTFNGAQVATGGSNRAGLYSVGSKLYFDGTEIADSQNGVGLHIVGNDLYFGSDKVGSGGSTPVVHSGLWLPPTQEASTYNKYTYNTLIAAYDDLKDNSSYPGTITKHTYSETSYGDYPLYHYRFTPANYTKTFYVQACIHGNEKDAPQTILRIFDIICNHCNEAAYSRLKPLRDNVRFIVVPCVSPWGLDHSSIRVPWTDWNDVFHDTTPEGGYGMNMNRNFDFIHQYGIDSGSGGNYPFQRSEVRHVKSIIEGIGVENIDYLFDNHDGGGVEKHFWFNYNMDGANATMARQLLADLIAEEERLRIAGGTDYRDFENADADELGYVHPNVNDSSGYSTGTTSAWANSTLGILASGPEYIGGYFGYTFNAEQMTRSLRIRANLLIYAYEMINTKGWLVNEPQDAEYFHWDYPLCMTRQGLRIDGADMTTSHTKVTFGDVYDRWDALAENYPTYVSKSSKLGENSSGDSIYSYTLGNGNKKVLLLGGSMRYGVDNKITEFGMYVLAEYLCNGYIVAQSSFLQTLKQDYTIVVLPCIDFIAGHHTAGNYERSLNNNFSSYAKWQISNDKCVPTTYGNGAADVGIFMDWIEANDDAVALISGGELKTTESAVGKPDYSTEYMTQVIIPKNYNQPQWLTDYCTHLEDDRGEDEPDVESTAGATCGDYAFDNYDIPAFYINLNVSQMWDERKQYAQSQDSADKYMYRNYETGRRIANIVNFILMAGGDINND